MKNRNSIRSVAMAVAFGLMGSVPAFAATSSLWLNTVPLDTVEQECLRPAANASVDKTPLNIGKIAYERGVGFCAPFHWRFHLDGNASALTAMVGIPEPRTQTILFKVMCDGKVAFEKQLTPDGAAVPIQIDLAGVQDLRIYADPLDAKWSAFVNLADAKITYRDKVPQPVLFLPESEGKVILTPSAPETPVINGARIFGARPGNEVLYTVAVSGKRPMTFSAEGLPEGLRLNPASGRITGTVKKPGSYKVKLIAVNALGRGESVLRLEIGDRIALTPPMGWNSWNIWARVVSDQKIRDAAKAMVDSGLINYGWQYINIDDCWMRKPGSDDPEIGEPVRCESCEGKLTANARFPDMVELTTYIHKLGLKAGIYASPGKRTCQQYEGCIGNEALDAHTFADWGFDLLKYDWCRYSQDLNLKLDWSKRNRHLDEVMRRPYKLMGDILHNLDRDVVYSMCQYGMGEVPEWGAEMQAQLWRVSGDLEDTWPSMTKVIDVSAKWHSFAKPGNWNDLDMMLLGTLGWDEHKKNRSLWGKVSRNTHLTPNEQYTHMTLWCMMASPLLLGNDLTKLDDFTLRLLTNPEVIAVNQDSLGKQARIVKKHGSEEVWLKELEDGSFALAMINRGYVQNNVAVSFKDIGLSGHFVLRDLWRQSDIDGSVQSVSRDIPRHGCYLYKMTSARAF